MSFCSVPSSFISQYLKFMADSKRSESPLAVSVYASTMPSLHPPLCAGVPFLCPGSPRTKSVSHLGVSILWRNSPLRLGIVSVQYAVGVQ